MYHRGECDVMSFDIQMHISVVAVLLSILVLKDNSTTRTISDVYFLTLGLTPSSMIYMIRAWNLMVVGCSTLCM